MTSFQEAFETVQPMLADISEKIGQAAGWSWEIILKQQMVNSGIGLFFSLLGLIGISYSVWGYKNSREYDDMRILYTFALILGLIAFITGTIVAIVHFVNPEYQALRDIFYMIN